MKYFLKYGFALCLLLTSLAYTTQAEEDDGTFGEVADLDLDSLESPPLPPAQLSPLEGPGATGTLSSQNHLSSPPPAGIIVPEKVFLEVPPEFKHLLDTFRGLSIKGLAQIQLDHVHSKSPLNPKAKSKSALNFRRLGILFTKTIPNDIDVGLQVDFNVDANKAEIGKFFIKKKFVDPLEPFHSLNTLGFAYEEASLGCETNISNISSHRVEKSIAASYFKNTIKCFNFSTTGKTEYALDYKVTLGVSTNSNTPKHYFAYTSFSHKLKLNRFTTFRYGTCLGYIHRAKTKDDTFLATLFTDCSYGKWETILEVFIQKNRLEGRTPLGFSVQQCYHTHKNNTLVTGYSFIHTQNSRDPINPSQLERNAPDNKVGIRKPQFQSMHALYVGDEWKINSNFKLIGGYELGLPRKAYTNSSIQSNTLHAIRLRLQIVF